MRRIILPVLLVFLSAICFAQTNADTKDDDTWLLVFGTLLAIGFAVVAIIGAVLLGLGIVALTALTVTGILSVSVVVGLYRRSLKSAVRTLIYISGAIGGMVLGIAGYYFYRLMTPVNVHINYALFVSSLGGALGGVLMAAILLGVLGRLQRRLLAR